MAQKCKILYFLSKFDFFRLKFDFRLKFVFLTKIRKMFQLVVFNPFCLGEEEFVNNSCVSKIEQTLGLTLDEPTKEVNGMSGKNGIGMSEKNVENLKFINEKDLEAKADLEELTSDGSETKEMQLCFKNLQAFSACFDAFAHGGNDVG